MWIPFAIKNFSFCGALFKCILACEGGTSKTWFLDLNSSSPCHFWFDVAYIVVWMFRFYRTILNLKARLQEQNLKKTLIFFHYHLNLFICCKTKSKIKVIFYWMSLFKQNKFFYRVNFLLTKLNFLKGDINIYFE